MELVQDSIQRRALLLMVFKFRVLLNLRNMGCEVGKWIELACDRVQ